MPYSNNSSDHPAQPNFHLGSKGAVVRSRASRPELLSAQNNAVLRAELQRQPEIRMDVVARARSLVADPAYPSIDILRHVAAQILSSQDLSEDES